MLPADRQLPDLHSLVIAGGAPPAGGQATALDAARLASCCPSPRPLKMCGTHCSASLLAALPGLSWLHRLTFFYILAPRGAPTTLRQMILSSRSVSLQGSGS